MKTTLRTLKLLILFCCSLATTAAFGQALTWTNVNAQVLPGGDIGIGASWSGDNLSGTATSNTPISGVTCTFDGTVPGNLFLFSANGINNGGSGNPIGGSFGANGITIHLAPTQTGSVLFYSTNAASVGMGFNNITVDAGAGQLILGDNTANQLVATLRPTSGIHLWQNNSSFPVVINPNFQIQDGGGQPHEYDFTGTGDFAITNYLRNNNSTAGNTVQWDTSGTTTWAPGGANDKFNDGGIGNVIINATAGPIIIKGIGLLSISAGNTLTHNGTLLKIDLGVGAQETLARSVLGAGPIQVASGTWTLTSGNSTFSGNLSLTGGELVANGTENVGSSGPLGVGGTISFTGGTLGYGPNNNFDYSPRFSTATGQAYTVDTGGQNVTYTNGIAGTANTFTKVGPGTLTLAGPSDYTGVTTVSGGRLVFQGPKSGTSDILVANGAALGLTATNTQVTPNTLSLTNATLEFNNVSSTTTPLIAANNLSVVGTVIVNVNSGNFAVGQTYPLFSWTTGPVPAVSLGFLSGALGDLVTNGNSIRLTVTALADNWNGTLPNWSAANTWNSGGVPATYADPTPVVFDDSALGATSVIVDVLVQPKSVIINNNTLSYTITSTAGLDIGGSANLTKNGSGILTLVGGANAYTGPTTLNAGIVTVGSLTNGGLASDIGASSSSATNLVFNGGILQYTGNLVGIDRSFSVATGGGGIDASGLGALNLTSSGAIGLAGPGARVFVLTGTSTATNTLAATLGDQGGSSALNKTGPGMWILTGNNGYSGVSTIGNGTLQLGVGGATGSLGSGNVVNNASLHVNRNNSLTINSVVSGGGSVNQDGTGTTILANNNTYGGGTTINAGTLQVGNGGATGSLNAGATITNNSKLIFNTSGQFVYTGNGFITGTGNVVVTGTGLQKIIGNNNYTGWTLIDTNATFQPTEGAQGAFASSAVTNYGVFKLVRQDQAVFGYSNSIVGSGLLLKDVNNNNNNDITLTGTNTYTGGTIIAGGGIVLGDGITTNAGAIVGNVVFTNSPTSQDDTRYLEFNRPDSFTFPGKIGGTTTGASGNAGEVIQLGLGVLTLTGSNTYLGGTIVSNGAVQVGAGGTTGSIGTGNITVGFPATLIFNRSDAITVPGVITGDGAVNQFGSGTTTLSASNTMTGATTVSNGTLVVSSSVNGSLTIFNGTLALGGLTVANPLVHVGNVLDLEGGTIVMALNKSLSPTSNSFVQADGGVLYTAGSLKLVNVGPSLKVGDQFTLFAAPIPNGDNIPVTGTGFTVVNHLGDDGSVTVASVVQVPAPKISKISRSGTNIVITATNNSVGGGSYSLLSTNNLKAPLSTWPVVSSGSFDGTGFLSVTNPIGTNSQFFILEAQ